MSLIAASLIALATAPVAPTPPESPSEEARHLIGAAASYALSNKSVGLPGPGNPTYYEASAWYAYRLLGPLHLGLIGDAGSLAGSVSILLDVHGSIGSHLAIGLGVANGPAWYWERQLRTLEVRGGRLAAHAEMLARITSSISLGARVGFVMSSFKQRSDVEPSDEVAHYYWAWPAGVVVDIRL